MCLFKWRFLWYWSNTRIVPSQLSSTNRAWIFTWFKIVYQSIESHPNYSVISAYCSSTSFHLTLLSVHISDADPVTVCSHAPLWVIHSITEGLPVWKLYFFHVVHMVRDAFTAVRRQTAIVVHLSPALNIQIPLNVFCNKTRVKICNSMENKTGKQHY